MSRNASWLYYNRSRKYLKIATYMRSGKWHGGGGGGGDKEAVQIARLSTDSGLRRIGGRVSNTGI